MVRKLSLAIAVALGVAPIGVTALGLGDIKLHSALNQNFNADIELLSVEQGEISDVQVELAPVNAFKQAGIDRPFFLSNLRFIPQQMPDGSSVIRVSSRDPIREPFLNFLIEVNWPKGSLVREYTVLLDPPVTLDRSPAPVRPPSSQMAPQSRATAVPVVPSSGAFTSYGPGIGEYGPTQRNETLWNIAKKVRHSGVAMEQMVMSLFHANPDAFINDNINNLKVGRILRVPSREDVLALASSRDARAAFRGQMDEWRSDRAASGPMVAAQGTVAESGSAPASQLQPEPLLPDAELRIASARPEGQGDEEGEAGVGENQDPMAESERLRQALIAAEEAKASALEEGEELQSRLVELESQLADLQKLLTLKNEQLARMQLAAAAASSEQPAATEEVPVADGQTLQPEIEIAGTEEAAGGTDAAETGAEPDLAVDAMPAPDEAPVDSESLVIEADEPATELVVDDEAPVDSESLIVEADEPATELVVNDEAPVDSETAIIAAETVAEAPIVADPETASEIQVVEPAEEAVEAGVTEQVSMAEATAESEPESVPVAPVAESQPEQVQAQPEAKSDPWSLAVNYAKKVAGDPAMLGIVIAVVVVFLALLWAVISRRRSSSAEFQESILVNTIDDETETSQTMVEAEPVSQTTEETSFLSDFSPSDIDALQDETGEVDPIAEADVYIAYGRYKQAEELIQQAIEREPQRLELKQKLFEILFATKDAKAFSALAEEAAADDMQQKDPAGWEKVVSMGQKLAPTAALFAAAASVGGLETQDDFSMTELGGDEATVANLDDLDLDLEGLGDLDELDAGESTTQDTGLDFDLDLNLDESPANEWEPGASLEEEEEEDTLLDLKSVAEEAESEAPADDLRLELPDETMEVGELDVSDTLDDLVPPERDNEGAERLQEPVIDFSDDEAALREDTLESLQLVVEDEPVFPADVEPEQTFEGPDAVSLDELELEAPADISGYPEQEADEVNTKLDLARAYVDMGDAEGARSLLEEVLNEGNNVQSGEAKHILAKLA